MDLLDTLIMATVFLFTTSVVALLFMAWSESRFAEKKAIKKRLLYISAGGKHGREKLLNYRDKVLRNAGTVQKLALKMPRVSTLDRMLLKSGLPFNASVFVLLSLSLGLIALLLGLKFIPYTFITIALAILIFCLPFAYLKLAENTYHARFQDQLPEALDLLARALRSGHAMTSGLEMVAAEMDPPISSEFGAAVDEINLGLTFQEAFENLCERVPSTDLRFFAISVIIQRETGGNVAEILDSISRLIRERIQFKRQVKALTAEGRLSAMVLIGLPIALFGYIFFVNHQYLSLLWTEPLGQYMLAGAIVLQILGAFIIKKIVTIEL
ncbi:Flp pilus inner membrane protein TadB, putative [Syntrophotalea carbinolica DSM 2380]|uniref:Flp pilus inner membrane protein TadB, putative n=1 Tax=Syntrophotalea carbinolica (strain DSM 2380 / NBRC 103641 / GraBd1) TaxID=338963 RepID=Q3A3R1_SYNC1|nr:type II secretion system F family protein [Syntrophotalea carbinolica]ABA88996.1 Flp pilus inner membrane protein TadB, putative [Syntrophotalea carbinolica DSM 2380]